MTTVVLGGDRYRFTSAGPANSMSGLDGLDPTRVLAGGGDEVVPVGLAGTTKLVSRSSVRYVQAQGDYARLHTGEGSHLVRIPLSQLADRWSDAGFVRIHRSFLVALPLVTELRRSSSGYVVRAGHGDDARELPVSRRHTRGLKDRVVRAAKGQRRPGRGLPGGAARRPSLARSAEVTAVRHEPQLRVLSFGYGHGEPPAADLTLDVREWFRDPHVSPGLRSMTGLDAEVHANVSAAPGAVDFVAGVQRVVAVLVNLGLGPVTVAFGCVGGRHRSVALASILAAEARAAGWTVAVEHRHVNRPVLPSTRTTLICGNAAPGTQAMCRNG